MSEHWYKVIALDIMACDKRGPTGKQLSVLTNNRQVAWKTARRFIHRRSRVIVKRDGEAVWWSDLQERLF